MNWEYLIIHHTGAEEKDTEQIRRYHRSLGWRDIGYNYVIEKSGLVAPGRSLEVPGAHCRAGGMNTRGIGIALIGNLEEHPPMQEQVDALVRLVGGGDAAVPGCGGERAGPPGSAGGGHRVPGQVVPAGRGAD